MIWQTKIVAGSWSPPIALLHATIWASCFERMLMVTDSSLSKRLLFSMPPMPNAHGAASLSAARSGARVK